MFKRKSPMPVDEPSPFDWQDHLLQMENKNSAESVLINQYKAVIDKTALEADATFLDTETVSALADERDEGQLSLDVCQTADALIIQAAIAGVNPQSVNVSLDNDILTIRGERHNNLDAPVEQYYYQECYWGRFSRSIVLPSAVEPQQINAVIKNGILTVTLQRRTAPVSVVVAVEEIE